MTAQPLPQLITNGPAYHQSGLIHRVWPLEGSSPHPTIVLLHGRSGNEDVTTIFNRILPQSSLQIAPRALLTDPRGGYSWALRPQTELPPLDAFDPAVAALDRFITSLPALYQADPEQIYLLGFSQGAALSFAYALHHPQKVKGIAALVGFLPTANDFSAPLEALRDLPIFMAVGRADETIPLPISQQTAETLVRAGSRLDYREYDTGHKLNIRGMRDLAAWWLSQPITVGNVLAK